MKKELYYCDFCSKSTDKLELFKVKIPVKKIYNLINIPQTVVEEKEICWDCCKKIAEFVDTI